MHYMNEYEIQRARELTTRMPVASRAVQFLEAFKAEVDSHSDGWAYWAAPVRAADKLMTLIERSTDVHAEHRRTDATDAELKKALTPIRAFYTRLGYKAGMMFPGDSDWNGREHATKAAAALQAAAPELLAACQYVVNWHREHDSGEGELFGLDFVTTCIAAIRKAKGVQ